MAFDEDSQQVSGVENHQPLTGYFSIINEILDSSLRPLLFTEQLELILTYLCSQRQLEFSGSWGVFVADQEEKQLLLSVCCGFPVARKSSCAQVPFGFCHCGQTIHNRKITLFQDKAPLQLADEDDSTGGHY